MRTVAEKVWDYLVEHKRPVTANHIAKHFIISPRSVERELRALVKKNVVVQIQVSKPFLYKIMD
jgi:predicted DNA-binding transcriptional regulator YafY